MSRSGVRRASWSSSAPDGWRVHRPQPSNQPEVRRSDRRPGSQRPSQPRSTRFAGDAVTVPVETPVVTHRRAVFRYVPVARFRSHIRVCPPVGDSRRRRLERAELVRGAFRKEAVSLGRGRARARSARTGACGSGTCGRTCRSRRCRPATLSGAGEEHPGHPGVGGGSGGRGGGGGVRKSRTNSARTAPVPPHPKLRAG